MWRSLTMGIVVLFALSGCSLVFGPDSETTPGPGVTFPPALPTAFDIGCNDVLTLNELHPLWDGAAMRPAPYAEAGAGGAWQMQATGLVQDGALACAWAKPGSEGDPQLVIIALDAAGDGYRRFEPSFLSGGFPYESQKSGDASQALCRNDSAEDGNQCHWNVLVGDTWISFLFQGVAEAEPSAEQTALVDTAITRIAASGRQPVVRTQSERPGCESLTVDQVANATGLDAASIRTYVGRQDDEVLGTSTPKFGQVMWAYAYERLGYSECSFQSNERQAVVMVAPGGAWVLDALYAIQPPVRQIDDLGRGVNDCAVSGGETFCTVAIGSGDDLVLVQLQADDAESGKRAGEQLVRLLLP